MSKIWIEVADPLFEITSKFGRLKSGVPDISAQDRNLTKKFKFKTCPQAQ